MSRISVDVDALLLERTREKYGRSTPEETVDLALRLAAGGELAGRDRPALEDISGSGWAAEPTIFDFAHNPEESGGDSASRTAGA